MKRAKGGDCSNSTDRISDLPEGILQRIFYFLSQKEAVRTSLLSKSWRNNWCTRPNLFLSDATFKDNKHEFVSVVDNALRRYRDQRMCVEIFHLCTSLDYSDSESVTILDKWIRAVRNMGVKKFRLSNFSKRKRSRVVEVPSGVFEAESLQGLHLKRFKLDEKSIERIVLFKHLKTLCLVQISVHEEVFHKVISCCPMIETLEVTRCKRLKTIKVSDLHNLTNFTFSMCGCPPSKKLHTIEIHTPSIKTVKISEGNIRWFHKGADFRNLQDLTLWGVDSSLEHLSSCKFPNLESLSLLWCDRMEEIKLFIDAPNIRKFDFIGDSVPSISFATTSSKWDCSVIHVRYDISDLTSLWFLKLKELLKSLSRSKISLYLTLDQYDGDVIRETINLEQDDNDGGNKTAVVVENFMSWKCDSSLLPSLLNGAITICRPRNVEDYLCGEKGEMERIECLWKILMQRESENEFSQLWLQELDDVIMEINDNDQRNEWHPITTLSQLQNYDRQIELTVIRFVLKWRQICDS